MSEITTKRSMDKTYYNTITFKGKVLPSYSESEESIMKEIYTFYRGSASDVINRMIDSVYPDRH